MSLTHTALRQKFADFWEKERHQYVSPSSLVLKDDPTTLFTSSGMQSLIPYLAGKPHPLGKRLYNIQPCFRAVDIDEVGDNRHTTFFEMMGNWSLGDYFKEEQLEWCWRFFTESLGLPKEKLYVTVFEGTKDVPRDEVSAAIWKKLGVSDNHLFFYGVGKNWWSRAGTPDVMPVGEIGGPDSEVFYQFDVPHDKRFGQRCHPNCDCGRFLEIGNSVFIQYRKRADGVLEELPQKNVDFGGGLERILAALNNDQDVFRVDVFADIIEEVVKITGQIYSDKNKASIRIIADHVKAGVFLLSEGVSTKSSDRRGASLRRLLERSVSASRKLNHNKRFLSEIGKRVIAIYKKTHPVLQDKADRILQDITFIEDRIFSIIANVPKTIEDSSSAKQVINGAQSIDLFLRDFAKRNSLNSLASVAAGTVAFDAKTTRGFPISESERRLEEALEADFNKSEFYETIKLRSQEHIMRSREAGKKLFTSEAE